ncbi:hypothetical protein O181_048308 [Austropuccinia psidii MF-1]|uniref:Uncharacterized protein n=1 Tax=Austropuccinia psidii MF-1 TaxID=1389203 RepID=A0A9Q3DVL1_9BASI|nr:hypothetical protein [Austropuccinia psidii MF-1]
MHFPKLQILSVYQPRWTTNTRGTHNRHWDSASQTDGCGLHISTRISISEDSSNDNSQVSSNESESSNSSSTHQNTSLELTSQCLFQIFTLPDPLTLPLFQRLHYLSWRGYTSLVNLVINKVGLHSNTKYSSFNLFNLAKLA